MSRRLRRVECGRKGRLREGRKRTLQSALVSSVMRLNPQQAPVYGESLLTVQLCDGELNLDEREVEFYLLFTGSTQRHLATTLRSSRATLQTICPSHDCCEPVQVTLCASRPGQPMEPVAEGRLCFVQDLAFDVAQILVGAAGQPDGLEGLLQLDECQLAPCEQLDCNLTLALQHLALPQDWNVLGPSTGSEPTPQETLLHFAARRGLPRVAAFLLQRSGGREALRLPNRQGETPLSLAESRGHTQLQLLLSQLSVRSRTEILPGTENGAPPLHCAGGHAVRHHPSLDTYTLTEPLANGAQPTGLLEDAEELRRVICCVRQQGGPSFQVASDLLHTTLQRCGSLRVTEEEDDLLRKARHSSDSTVSLSKSGQENGGETSVCDCGGGSEGLQLPSDNGSNEGCECPCENSCVESTRRMERELGTAPVNIVDSINRPHKTESSPVWEEGLGAAFSELPFGARQEETDITHGTISTTQKSLEADSKENQEAVSKAERAVETQTCDNSETVCAGSSSTVENMGHSQSQGDQEISDGEPEDQTSQETEQIELSVTEVDNCRLLHEKSLQDGEGDVTPAEVAEEICAVQKSSVLSLGLQGSVGNEEATAGSERSSTVAAEQGSIEDQCKLETSHSEQSKETPAVDCVAAERDNGTGAHGESTARSQLAGANCDEQDKEDTEKPRDPASSDEPSSDVMAQQPHEEKGGERESEDTGCTERQSCECASEPLLSYTTCEKETLLQAAKSATDGDHEDLHAPSADPVVESKEPLTLVNESAVCCVLVVETSNTSREDNESICDITDVNLDADTSFSTNGDNSPEADAVIKEQGAHISSDATSTQDVTPEETDKENICDEDASELKSGAVSQFASEEQGTKDLSEVTSVLEMGPEKTVEDEGGVCAEESGAAQLDMMPVLHVEEDTVHSENESGRITGPNEVTTIQEVSFEKTMENQQSVCVEDTTDAKMDAACEFPFNDSSVQSVGSPRVAEEQVNIPDDLVSTMEVDPREKSEPVEEQTFSPTETQSPLGVVSEGQEGSESGEVPKASLVTEADLQLPCSEQSAEPPEETARTENLSQQEHVEENNGSELRREHQAIELQTEVIVQKPPMSPDSQSDEVHQEGLVARGQLSDSQVTQVSDPEILVEVTLDTAVTVVSSEELPLETLPAVPEEPTDNSVCVSKETMTSEAASESVSETDIGTAAAWVATPPEAPGDAVHLDPRSHTSEEISPEPTSTSAGSDSHGSVGLGEFSNLVDNKRDLVVGLELPRTLDMVEEVSEEGYEDAPDGDTPTAGTEMSPVLGTREGDAKEEIHREKETCCSVDSCVDPSNVGQVQRSRCPEFPDSLAPQAAGSSGSTPQPDSSHDADGLFCTDPADDSVFQKGEGTPAGDSVSEASASCSSTDDTSSTGPTSSALGWSTGDTSWSSEEARPAGDLGGDAEEEAKDRLTEVPVCSAILRSSARSLSPFRRHSWEPGRNSGREAEMSPRSSLRTLGEGRPTFHKRSMSWCPSDHPRPDADELGSRSYSLEGLSADRDAGKETIPQAAVPRDADRLQQLDSRERGSLGSLTEEEQETHAGDYSSLDSKKSASPQLPRHSCQSMTLPLTKSVSMLAISHKELDSMWPSSKVSPPQGYGVSDEDPVRLRGCPEGKSGTKVSRTFSYLKNKMIKKNKDKDKNKAKDQETKEKEKTLNGHVFSTTNCAPSVQCTQCNKAIGGKEASFCSSCSAHVHKGCRETLPLCSKVKMKQKPQFTVPDCAAVAPVVMRQKTAPSRERPRSAILVSEDPSAGVALRRPTSILPFQSSNLSKSVSISNIAGPVLDDMPLKGIKYLSQSTDSLHKTSKVNESTESLVDEGSEIMDSQLMGEFEADAKELEADSWSLTVGKDFLKQLKKDVVKRQDVIYELIQTEMHHVRTLKIMADVYGKGLQKEVQLDVPSLDRLFPVLDSLLDLHSLFLARLLEKKRQSQRDGQDRGFVIRRIGDVLIAQFSNSNADHLKKVYGKFCSRHNEAVNFYKELHAKDKRFQAFIKKKMSSTIVRRLSIPECILLVTQRITKYPVLLQRLLQHTKESEEDHRDVVQALRLVKEIIAAVDGKVNKYEQKRRLWEVYGRTDHRSIMRMKGGQMFAREDLVRGQKLLRDGPLQLKTSAGRLKDVHALLLSDVLVFLQEKDQKYVFASLDQRSTVISLQKLIVREVANEERGFFVITAGIEQPEMVEVHASSKEERNTWMKLIQDTMHSMAKDEDEGGPSETEEDRRLLESKAKEMRDLLQKKDEQIAAILEEKVKLFRDMCDMGAPEASSTRTAALFRTGLGHWPKGEPIIKDALKTTETLQMLVNGGLGGVGGGVGPVCPPRRAETFGGFDSHQTNSSKHGEKDESEEASELRRTESDSVLKKGGDGSVPLLLKWNSEQLLHSVTHLYDLLSSLEVVVVQQDAMMEDQRQALSERPPSRPASRPSSLVEQEKQRSLEKQRQEAAELQKQQTAHAEERRRRERDWEARERQLAAREARLRTQEEETRRLEREMDEARRELQERKEEYQRDLERLRDAQRRLDRDREAINREAEKMEQTRCAEGKRKDRTPSSTSDDSLRFQSTSSLEREPGECELSSSPRRDSLTRVGSKRKGRSLNLFSSSSSHKAAGGSEGQNLSRLLPLPKAKEKKDKKKKKGKGSVPQSGELLLPQEPRTDGEIFFC